MIDDAVRVRVIRAFLGMHSRTFARRVGISAGTLTAWERGRATPQVGKRTELAKLCEESGIGFLPSGYPVPINECFMLKPEETE